MARDILSIRGFGRRDSSPKDIGRQGGTDLYEFLRRFPTLEALAEADQEELADIIYPLGPQNQRSNALVSIGQELSKGRVPDDEEELLELPYVGRYAANATLCFAFGEHRPIVDANVVRVYNRVLGKNYHYRDEAAWEFAEEVLPESYALVIQSGYH